MTTPTTGASTTSQKVVHAMWRTLNRPATAMEIAEAAGLGYSTVTPVLRHLRATGQATRDETGHWQLLLDGQAPTDNTGPDDEPELPAGHGRPDATSPDDELEPIASAADTADGGSPANSIASPQPTHKAAAAPTAPATPPAPDTAGNDVGGQPSIPPVGDPPTTPDSATPESVTAEAVRPPATGQETPVSAAQDGGGKRPRRTPAHPKRAKGALRAAVLQVLRAEPDRAFKVSQVCKALNDATDGSSNLAGAGAVANALDKLAGDGSVRRHEGSPATFQAE